MTSASAPKATGNIDSWFDSKLLSLVIGRVLRSVNPCASIGIVRLNWPLSTSSSALAAALETPGARRPATALLPPRGSASIFRFWSRSPNTSAEKGVASRDPAERVS